MLPPALPFVLGGHSFIPELGNEDPLDEDAQLALVAACLDAGITRFDTTYAPERVGLGRALARLGRRDEATIIAWNFFHTDDGRYLVGPEPYQPHRLALMQEQLQSDTIEMLVVHRVNDEAADARQLELAASWKESGSVGRLGTWAPAADVADGAPYSFMVTPRNIASPNDAALDAARRVGWETLLTSPFNRGWLLDSLVGVAVADGQDADVARERIADTMLRFALHDPRVDAVVIGIRNVAWIARNAAAVSAGAPAEADLAWVRELLGRIDRK